MKVVTSGKPYIDIDAYGGIIAYAELLQVQGHDAVAASSGILNESISRSVLSWPAQLSRSTTFPEDTEFSIIDISDPAHFDSIVKETAVREVFDHHPGFEKYWQANIGGGATIEFIGAACTLVYERWQAAGLIQSISQTSARLLICGILDNTLNFNSDMTTPRDIAAYDSLLPIAELPLDWPEVYFLECQAAIENNILRAVQNDIKEIDLELASGPVTFGQLALWNRTSLKSFDVEKLFSSTSGPLGSGRLINIICIGEKQSLFLTDDPALQVWLSDLIGITFERNTATADRLWLRKEIVKKNLERLAR